MAKKNERRPFKVMLDEDAARQLGQIAASLKTERDNYQIGIGTVVSELLESLVAHPELLSMVLDKTGIQKAGQAKSLPPEPKKGQGERRSAA